MARCGRTRSFSQRPRTTRGAVLPSAHCAAHRGGLSIVLPPHVPERAFAQTRPKEESVPLPLVATRRALVSVAAVTVLQWMFFAPPPSAQTPAAQAPPAQTPAA